MRKASYFEEFRGPGWPTPDQLKPYFFAPLGRRWISETGNDSWGFDAEGIDGTEHFDEGKGRIDAFLTIICNPFHGVLLQYKKVGGAETEVYFSRGDVRRLREWVETQHGDIMSVGLFIASEIGWEAVKEFIERDGARPRCIAWIDGEDLPDYAFPDPASFKFSS
jgi:hypothetical protein